MIAVAAISALIPGPPRNADHSVGFSRPTVGERVLELLERAHHGEPVPRRTHRIALPPHEPEEVLELEPERLVRRHARAELVPGARAPLAVRLGGPPPPPLLDRDLLLELHVVEDGHLVAPHDGD